MVDDGGCMVESGWLIVDGECCMVDGGWSMVIMDDGCLMMDYG